MSYALLKHAFTAAHDPFEVKDDTAPPRRRVEAFVKQNAPDRRYGVTWHSVTESPDGIVRATVTYRGVTYFFHAVLGEIRTGALSRRVYMGWSL